jgi:hypothetical protein
MLVGAALRAQGRRPLMLGDSVAALVLVTAASKKPGAPGNNRPSTSLTGRFGPTPKNG